jgi:tetratricopeptide (TPR) repeat protein
MLALEPPEPDRSEVLLTTVDLYLQLKKFELADARGLAVLDALSKIRGPQQRMVVPLQFKALVKLGVTRLRLGKLQDSEEFLMQALALGRKPENLQIFAGNLLEPTSALVEVFLEDGKVTEACELADSFAERPIESGMVCENTRITYAHTHTHTQAYTYTLEALFLCVCVCVSMLYV